MNVFLLLCLDFRRIGEAVLMMLTISFSLVVAQVAALGYNLSVAVWVGNPAPVGASSEIGVVMIICLNQSLEKRRAEGRLSSWDRPPWRPSTAAPSGAYGW